MIFQEIQSKNINSIGYDTLTETLGVIMNNNLQAVYLYDKVPLGEYLDFSNSESKGKHFVKNIKGKFPYRKVPKGN